MQPARVNGPGTGILTGAGVIVRSRRYSATTPNPRGAAISATVFTTEF